MANSAASLRRFVELPHVKNMIEFLTHVPAAELTQLVGAAKLENAKGRRDAAKTCRRDLKELVKAGLIDSSTSDKIVAPYVAQVDPVAEIEIGSSALGYGCLLEKLNTRVPNQGKRLTRRLYWGNAHTYRVLDEMLPDFMPREFEGSHFVQPADIDRHEMISLLRQFQNNWINLAEIYLQAPTFFGDSVRPEKFDRAPLESHRFLGYVTNTGERMASVFGSPGTKNHLEIMHDYFDEHCEYGKYRVH